MTSVAIGIIGLGRMGEALAKVALSIPNQATVHVTTRNAARASQLAGSDTRVVVAEPEEILRSCDYIVISLAANSAREVLTPLTFAPTHHIVSVVAEIGYHELKALTKGAGSVSRVLTLPSVVTGGQMLPCFRPNAAATYLFAADNELIALEEEYDLMTIWSVTGLISSIMMVGDVAARWLESAGIEKRYAEVYSKSMVAEAHGLSEHSFEAGLSHVSTPGGLNVMMRERLQRSGIEQQFAEGLNAINQRLLKSNGYLFNPKTGDALSDEKQR